MVWYCVYYHRSRISNATLSLCSFHSFNIGWVDQRERIILLFVCVCVCQKLIIIQSIFQSAYRFKWQLYRIKFTFNRIVKMCVQKVQQSNHPPTNETFQILLMALPHWKRVQPLCSWQMAQECFWLHFIYINYPGRDLALSLPWIIAICLFLTFYTSIKHDLAIYMKKKNHLRNLFIVWKRHPFRLSMKK